MKTASISSLPISHELSNIGKLDFQLHGIAAQFYLNLESDGLIDYLKKIDHLGFISKCHPGNHHKRWDYVCLQLYFLQKLKHSAFSTGLNKNTEIGGIKTSYQEILQTFILFANIGHLEGTIASEKGLFMFLQQNAVAKSLFLREIDQVAELREFREKVFSAYDFYKVKYLIALNYLFGRKIDQRILSAIQLILRKYLHERDIAFEKLRILYLKIRKVSFVYLDSFHCPTPVQVNLSKILVNIFNYDNLFNPDDTDYDNILEACETVLSKELYISPKSSTTFCIASNEFCRYLISRNHGKKAIDYSNFILSLLNQPEKPSIRFPYFGRLHVFHFYISKDALKVFDLQIGANFESTIVELNRKEHELLGILNKGIKPRKLEVTFQHDMRKSLLFFTAIIPKDIAQQYTSQILINFNNFFLTIIKALNFDEYFSQSGFVKYPFIIARFYMNLRKDIIRRYFLYVLKFLFERDHRLNLFIKFQYRQLISEMNKSANTPLVETLFSNGKSELLSILDNTAQVGLPDDVANNIGILKYIVANDVKLKGNFQSFVSLFPIEIEEMTYDSAELDKSGNSERRRTITDIDAILILFQKSKYELYLIEGKKHKSGFQSACARDLNAIKSLCINPTVFPQPVLINDGVVKGGYLKIAVP